MYKLIPFGLMLLAAAGVYGQGHTICPVDSRTGADLETATKYDWYAEVRYTYAMLVGEIVEINSYDNEALPQCSRPVLVSFQPHTIWRKQIKTPIKAIADDDVGLLHPGTQVLVYLWERFDLPHPVALVKRLDEAGTELGYLRDSVYDEFEVAADDVHEAGD